jgi:cation transport ATPase
MKGGGDMKNWQDDYKRLNLMSGKISFILEDDQDMIEIHYNDGMLIDIGYIKRLNSYFITVVSSDTAEGWNNPLDEIKVENKAELFEKIQEAIYKHRQNKYLSFETEPLENVQKQSFFQNFKGFKKKHQILGVAGIVLLLCVIRGLAQKFIWQASFWKGFLHTFALFVVVFNVTAILYVLKKKSPKVASFIARTLLILGILFLLGIVLLVIVLILKSFLHFDFT